MTLIVKDPEAHRLAVAISQLTGEPVTRVVIEALRERHEKLQRGRDRATVEELLRIAARAAAGVGGPVIDHADFLYDERGLAR